ncbi:MAG: hypothetical protein IPP94_19445 [Ignavibacteria bacterium]|nr:hypothetical protein [Ignavibacteria bacterium]
MTRILAFLLFAASILPAAAQRDTLATDGMRSVWDGVPFAVTTFPGNWMWCSTPASRRRNAARCAASSLDSAS